MSVAKPIHPYDRGTTLGKGNIGGSCNVCSSCLYGDSTYLYSVTKVIGYVQSKDGTKVFEMERLRRIICDSSHNHVYTLALVGLIPMIDLIGTEVDDCASLSIGFGVGDEHFFGCFGREDGGVIIVGAVLHIQDCCIGFRYTREITIKRYAVTSTHDTHLVITIPIRSNSLTKIRFGVRVDNSFKCDDILIFLASGHRDDTCKKCKK